MPRGLRWLRRGGLGETLAEEQADARPFARGPMVIGLLGVVMLCLFFPVPRRASLAPKSLLLIAGGLLFDAIGVSVVVALAVSATRAMFSKEPLRVSGVTLRATWATAIWVPAWIFSLRTPSMVTMIAACLLMATGALYLRGQSRSKADAGFSLASRREEARGLLAYPFQFDSEAWTRVLLPSLGLALLVELTAMIAAMGAFGWASLLAGACAAALAWRARSEESREDSNSRAAAALALAFVFTLVVLLPYLRSTPFLVGVSPAVKESSVPAIRGSSAGTDDGYSGIILLSPNEEHKKIVVPVRKDVTIFSGRLPQPVEIPFNGAYWYFKAPDKRPRATARVVKGSSTKASIRSTDWSPLLMEAHQRLDVPIDLGCCSAIDIVVQNADRHEGVIALELWVNSVPTRAASEYYLGTAIVPSSQQPTALRSDSAVPAAAERLEYPIPSAMQGKKFDEIKVVVRSAPGRARFGAQIGIRKFVLEP